MSNTAIGKIIIFSLVLLACAVLIFSDFGGRDRVRVYDCGMAEWHPDIPIAVKTECRRLRYEQLNQKNV